MTLQDQWLLQKERALAWTRVGFAVVALLVIQLNPSRIADAPTLSYISLVSFILYSLLILYVVQNNKTDFKILGLATTALDLLFVTLIVYSTGAYQTPFFVYYLFPVIAASSRYGIKGGVAVALVGVTCYGFNRIYLEWQNPLALDVFIIRSVYLIVLAYIFGYLSEFQNKQNQKLLALSKAAGKVSALEERRRIARELHDGLLQSLATHLLRLETCRKHFLASPDDLDRELRFIEDDTRNSMKSIRLFLAGRETQPFPPGMFLDYLKGDLSFLRDGLGMQVILETESDNFYVPEAMERDVYFILREGLMNAMRHSHATCLEIALKQKDSVIEASIKDDGVGFDPAQPLTPDGHGLNNIRERMEKLRGELSLESSPGKGTRISFVIPLRQEKEYIPAEPT